MAMRIRAAAISTAARIGSRLTPAMETAVIASPMMAMRPSGRPVVTGASVARVGVGWRATSQRKLVDMASMGRKAKRQEAMSVSNPASQGPIKVASAQTTAKMPKAGVTSTGSRESLTRM